MTSSTHHSPMQPPTSLMAVLHYIDYEDALQADDPRYVPTEAARSSHETFKLLAKRFVWDPASDVCFPPARKHVLFFGHVGSGKTTELRRYAQRFNTAGHFRVVEVDVLEKLDRANLQYADVVVAMAERLLEELDKISIYLSPQVLEPLHLWFATTLLQGSQTRESSAELKAGAEASSGLPGLIKLLAGFTASFKFGATYRNEWRREIRNHFSTLVGHFNRLIAQAELALAQAGQPARLLFMIDGTDKMNGEDTHRFFVQDAEQLLMIQSLLIYTAPLSLKYDGALSGTKLTDHMVLPMLKLYDRAGARWEPGWTAMTQLLLNRIDRSLFAAGSEGDAQIARLVECSGGHPRELLRLLKHSCEFADEVIDAKVVDIAIGQLASDYRRFLKPDDYGLLVAIDLQTEHMGNDDTAQELLHKLALLEYNDGSWRRSHPVVRTLEGYQAALRRAKAAASPPAA